VRFTSVLFERTTYTTAGQLFHLAIEAFPPPPPQLVPAGGATLRECWLCEGVRVFSKRQVPCARAKPVAPDAGTRPGAPLAAAPGRWPWPGCASAATPLDHDTSGAAAGDATSASAIAAAEASDDDE
jgi:hypothetical protein